MATKHPKYSIAILHTERAIKKWLPRLEVLDPIQLERVGDLAENTFGDLQPLRRRLINFIFSFGDIVLAQ